jgi:Predicted UDP-glucose 6-dehydrogenase
MKITVAGVGYVGLSLAVLFAQHHEVTAITTTPKKADKLNDFISPIQDDEIERFFREVKEGKLKLSLHTTVDKEAAYKSEDQEWVQKPKAELSGAPGGLFDLIIQKRHREEMNLKSLPV